MITDQQRDAMERGRRLDVARSQLTGTVGVIIPTRERVEQVRALIWAIGSTADVPHSQLAIVLGVDASDRQMPAYRHLVEHSGGVHLAINHGPRGHGRAINTAAAYARHALRATTLIKLDDDHMPRTLGWPALLAAAAGPWGMAYPDDGHQGAALPTVCAWGSSLYDALHRMVPGALKHLYIDDYWRELGRALDCLAYLPDVLVEHMHPHAGKAPDTMRYRALYAEPAKLGAEASWKRFRASQHGLPYDVAAVRRARIEAGLDA